MPINVRIPEVLRKLTGGADLVAIEASTVGEMLTALEQKHPGLKERICDDKGLTRDVLERAYVALAAEMMGTARWLLEATLAYAKSREQFEAIHIV